MSNDAYRRLHMGVACRGRPGEERDCGQKVAQKYSDIVFQFEQFRRTGPYWQRLLTQPFSFS